MSAAAPDGAEASLEFLGTATTLLRLGPFTVLTDPNFLHRGQRAYLGRGLWSRRLTEPSKQPDQLPELTAVLLSHLHGDHFDRIARRELDRTVPVLTTPGAARRLRRWGFAASTGLPTWETTELTSGRWSLRITSVPGVHAPLAARPLLPSVMGSVLELRHGAGPVHRTYVSGDTLFRPWLREVVERTGPLDAAVVHLGGTRVLGLLVTMDGPQGADLVDLLDPGVTIPVHHDDYGVFRSPLSEFTAELERRGDRRRVSVVARGERVALG